MFLWSPFLGSSEAGSVLPQKFAAPLAATAVLAPLPTHPLGLFLSPWGRGWQLPWASPGLLRDLGSPTLCPQLPNEALCERTLLEPDWNVPTSLLGLTEAPDMTRDGQASWGGCHHPGAEGTMSEAVSRTSWRHGSLTGAVPPGENTATTDPVHRDERAASCQAPQGNPGEAERESVSPPAAERPEQRVCLTWPRSQGWVCGAIPLSLPTFLPRHPEQRTSCDTFQAPGQG